MFKTISAWLESRKKDRHQTIPYVLLLIGAGVGLMASFVLSVEAVELAKNPNAVLPCSINAVLNCATVASHASASVFGFPSSFLGMMTFPVMVTIAVAGLMGTRFPRWFMLGAQVGVTLGAVFALWMFYMSYAVIQVLCPWCLTVDAAMLVLFLALTRLNILNDHLSTSKRVAQTLKTIVRKQYDVLFVVVIAIVALFAILIKYRDVLFA